MCLLLLCNKCLAVGYKTMKVNIIQRMPESSQVQRQSEVGTKTFYFLILILPQMYYTLSWVNWDQQAIFWISRSLLKEENKWSMTVEAKAIKRIWACAKFINRNFASYQKSKVISHFLKNIKRMSFHLLQKIQCILWSVFQFVSMMIRSVCSICPSHSKKDLLATMKELLFS